MRYEIGVHYHGRSAKTKAIITGRPSQVGFSGQIIILEAKNDEQAYLAACFLISPMDHRPVSGKSYVRNCRVKDHGYAHPVKLEVGDSVVLHQPFLDYGDGGFTSGAISEVLSSNHYSIALQGYCNRYVDFSTSEFAKVGGMSING